MPHPDGHCLLVAVSKSIHCRREGHYPSCFFDIIEARSPVSAVSLEATPGGFGAIMLVYSVMAWCKHVQTAWGLDAAFTGA